MCKSYFTWETRSNNYATSDAVHRSVVVCTYSERAYAMTKIKLCVCIHGQQHVHVYVNSENILIFIYKDNFITLSTVLIAIALRFAFSKTPAVENMRFDGLLVAGMHKMDRVKAERCGNVAV
mgnify:FL=1